MKYPGFAPGLRVELPKTYHPIVNDAAAMKLMLAG
jgi:hypothetical protein